MEKVLCFRISDVDLFLEQTLVEYNNIPIFFVCNDANNRYLALCTDASDYNYVITKVAIDKLYAMLNGKISMRDVFLNCRFYWEVLSEEDIDSDVVLEKDISLLNRDLLPEQNAFFQILDSEVAVYLEKIRTELYSADGFSKIIQSEQSVNEENILLKGSWDNNARFIEQYTDIINRDIHQTVTANYILSKAVYYEQMRDLSTSDIGQSCDSIPIDLNNYPAAA